MRIGTSSDYETIFYHVRPGDSLSKLIRRYYGQVSLQQQNEIIKRIQVENPEIKNPNLIYPGQSLVFDIPEQKGTLPPTIKPVIVKGVKDEIKALQDCWKTATEQEKELLSTLIPVMMGTGSASLSMLDTAFKTNSPLVAEMVDNFNNYKAGKISKGQYDYQRQKLLAKLKAKLGPLNRILNGNRPANEVLRISRSKGSSPVEPMTKQFNKMARLSKYASRGGIVLSAASLGLACNDIANTDDRKKKNEILFETVGNVGGGVIYGFGSVLILGLMATPVGWVGALIVGIGGAAFSYGSGKMATSIYSLYGNNVDIVNTLHIDSICTR